MTDKEKVFLDRINEYADKVLDGIDPQKTKVSFQLGWDVSYSLTQILSAFSERKGEFLR